MKHARILTSRSLFKVSFYKSIGGIAALRQRCSQMLPPMQHLKIYLLLKIEKNSPTGKALTSQWGPAVINKYLLNMQCFNKHQ